MTDIPCFEIVVPCTVCTKILIIYYNYIYYYYIVERKAPDPVPSQVIRQEPGADIEITFTPVKGPGADIKITFAPTPPHPPPKTFYCRNGY